MVKNLHIYKLQSHEVKSTMSPSTSYSPSSSYPLISFYQHATEREVKTPYMVISGLWCIQSTRESWANSCTRSKENSSSGVHAAIIVVTYRYLGFVVPGLAFKKWHTCISYTITHRLTIRANLWRHVQHYHFDEYHNQAPLLPLHLKRGRFSYS